MSDPIDNLPPITGIFDGPDEEAGPFAVDQQVDGFRILRELGRGGMCIVYEALDLRLDRTVALKALRPSLARVPSVAKRFLRESMLVAALGHPNIVPVFSQGTAEDGTPYFTMQLVTGANIGDVVARRGPLEATRACRLAADALKALQYAHEHNIIHRDVTPRNILLSDDETGVRLVDFGVAQDTSGRWFQTTQNQATLGTVAFMSPEQNLGDDLDARTDIFSMGLVLYLMLTGRLAYQAENRAQLALAYKLQTPPPPSQFNAGATAELDGVVMRMIAPDRNERYRSCEAACLDLQIWLNRRQLPQARRIEAAPKGRPRPRRGRWVPAAAAIAAVVALACGAGWLILRQGPVLPPASAGALPVQAGLEPRVDLARAPNDDPPATPVEQVVAIDPEPPAAAEPPARAAAVDPPAEPAEAGPGKVLPEPDVPPKPRAALPRAVVLWIYQPDAARDFDDDNILLGQATLHIDEAQETLGLYGFDPVKGLVAYKSPVAGDLDFRVSLRNGKLVLISDPRKDGGARVVRVDDSPAFNSKKFQDLKSQVTYDLTPSASLFVFCSRGGHALLRVERVLGPSRAAKP